MAVPTTSSTDSPAGRLNDQRVVFVGKLASMSRRDAQQLVRQQGATIVAREFQDATLVVLGDGETSLPLALKNESPEQQSLAEGVAEGRITLWRESELWQRLGLVDGHPDSADNVQRLYTPAMLAELLQTPVAAIRRWHRQGALVACRCVRRLPYFDFAEVAVARHLVMLLEAGCSLRVIDRKLAELKRLMPGVERPLADSAIVVTGRCLFLRRGEDLAEPGGQLLLDFDAPLTDSDEAAADDAMVGDREPSYQPLLKMSQAGPPSPAAAPDELDTAPLSLVDCLLQEAANWEDRGELARAAETYRTLLVANGPAAEIHFALADVLYRMGDLSAARERYYAAIELDDDYVEARANLGCVLAENDELELAVAAFEGALAFHPDYADVHYHLANTMDCLEQTDQAHSHWRIFLALAPESPWAEMARERLGLDEADVLTVSSPLYH